MPTWKSRGTTAIKLGGPAFTKVDRAAGRCFSKLSLVYKGTQSVSALSKEALFPEDGQPMICYYLRWFQLSCCSLGYKPCRGVDVLFRGCSSSLQPQEATSHPCTQLLSAARVSYLFGRMSFIFTPLGRAASH